MITLTEYCQRVFGEKVYKLSLNGGFTCPNRDGTKGTRGCIFCSAGGSGEFSQDAALSPDEQIERAKALVEGKFRGSRYIAYFQPYTNTYAPVERLEALFSPILKRDDIAGLSVATRPDCLGDEIEDLLGTLNGEKPVWVELGLQSARDDTGEYIRRGYPTSVYDDAVRRLGARGIHVITHLILGLPGESEEDMARSVRHAVKAGTEGVKLQLLHVLSGTDLAEEYRKGLVPVMSEDEYINALRACVKELGEDTVVHRLTGDGPGKLLIAPLWSRDKKHVLNRINREVLGRNV